MTDEARIARLTELARRVWTPIDDDDEIVIDVSNEAWMVARRRPRWTPLLTLRCDHSRTPDALEAALLVLAGEPPAWVEALAREFDAEVERLRAQISRPGNGDLSEMGMLSVAWCARELRERAKGEP